MHHQHLPVYPQESYTDFNFMITLQIVEEFLNLMTFFFLKIQDDLIMGIYIICGCTSVLPKDHFYGCMCLMNGIEIFFCS
jgi:hypothetical protein